MLGKDGARVMSPRGGAVLHLLNCSSTEAEKSTGIFGGTKCDCQQEESMNKIMLSGRNVYSEHELHGLSISSQVNNINIIRTCIQDEGFFEREGGHVIVREDAESIGTSGKFEQPRTALRRTTTTHSCPPCRRLCLRPRGTGNKLYVKFTSSWMLMHGQRHVLLSVDTTLAPLDHFW